MEHYNEKQALFVQPSSPTELKALRANGQGFTYGSALLIVFCLPETKGKILQNF
ncbi:Sialic acid transporter (permease) NanT [Acetobacter pomorum]|nr:Sialic acid transporter (permease) NanT [Acetobacter pomorum]